MSAIVFDIEGNGFLYEITKLHCLVGIDIQEQVVKAYHDAPGIYPKHGSLEEGLRWLVESDCIIGHNICGYDVPAIEKLRPDLEILGDQGPSIIDTQKMAELLFPENKKQSIKEWVRILSLPDPKIHIKDFSELTQQLLDRCVGDVKNNVAIYRYLLDTKKKEERHGNSFNTALYTEQEVALIHSNQVQHGVWYDVDLALATSHEFQERMQVIQEKVRNIAPPNINVPTISKERYKAFRSISISPDFKDHLAGFNPLKKSKFERKEVSPYIKTKVVKGKEAPLIYTSDAKKYFEDKITTVKGPYCKITTGLENIYNSNSISHFGLDYITHVKGPYNKIEITPFNCSSDTEVKDFLLSIGWIPIEYNYSKSSGERTSPKLTEESFVSLPPGLGQDIAEYRVLQHRRSLIINDKDPEEKGALSKVRDDHRVPAEAFTCGTPTARYRHNGAVN